MFSDVVKLIDQQTCERHGACRRAEHDKVVRVQFSQLVGHFIIGDAAAKEVHVVPVGFEQVTDDLRGEFFGLFRAAKHEGL